MPAPACVPAFRTDVCVCVYVDVPVGRIDVETSTLLDTELLDPARVLELCADSFKYSLRTLPACPTVVIALTGPSVRTRVCVGPTDRHLCSRRSTRC